MELILNLYRWTFIPSRQTLKDYRRILVPSRREETPRISSLPAFCCQETAGVHTATFSWYALIFVPFYVIVSFSKKLKKQKYQRLIYERNILYIG